MIKIDDAEHILNLNRAEASKLLSRWKKQGWIRRVGPGAYVAASLESLTSEHVLEDPWILVPALFEPAYIGGRSATEYWDLTEQIFNDTMVMTAAKIRQRNQVLHNNKFSLKQIDRKRIFGTTSIWRVQSKVAISDVHRTIIDILDDPAIGGGIQHVEDCLKTYLKREDSNIELLIQYGDRLNNGALFKRLGFLAERNGASKFLIAECKKRLTTGNAKLDPALDCNRLVTRWRLWVPQRWKDQTGQ
ncbi:MAG: hypothetical protein GW822_14410 [Sphingomonadales bacterium]|nr:hypothetical protein [Sphingomonadales bacterium]